MKRCVLHAAIFASAITGCRLDGTGSAPGTSVFEGRELVLTSDLPFGDYRLNSTGNFKVQLEQEGGRTTALHFVRTDDVRDVGAESVTLETAALTQCWAGYNKIGPRTGRAASVDGLGSAVRAPCI